MEAKTQYNKMQEDKSFSPQLNANIYRQMGWMHQCWMCLERGISGWSKPFNICRKVMNLTPSLVSLCTSWKILCQYRNSVDKSKSNCDTWCSIGVLYQQQNQPMDALQANICAVQLDKEHWAAWTNLGILYEYQSQPQDALACYTNDTRNGTVNPSLHQRIKYIKTQMASTPTPATSASGKQGSLPTVEDAWNLPISNEMSNR